MVSKYQLYAYYRHSPKFIKQFDTFEDFYIFDYNRKQLEKICGREVILPIIHKNELQKLASGNHKEAKKTLDKHQINPEII